MVEKLINLLERFVVAFEKIADGQQNGCKCDSEIIVCKNDPIVQKEINDIPRDYEGIERQPDGREVLLKLCKERGIKVPSGTRTKTLVKMLNEHDKNLLADDNIMENIMSEVDTSLGQTEVTLEKGSEDLKIVVEKESGNLEEFEDIFKPETEESESNDEFPDDEWPDEWID